MLSVMDNGGLVVSSNWFAKPNPVAERVALGPVVTPVPLIDTDCGLPTSSSVNVSVAASGPNWPGANLTSTEQSVPAVKVEPHVLVPSLKSEELTPIIATEFKVSEKVPVFVSVSVCAVLVIPTNCMPKSRLGGASVRLPACSRTEMV